MIDYKRLKSSHAVKRPQRRVCRVDELSLSILHKKYSKYGKDAKKIRALEA